MIGAVEAIQPSVVHVPGQSIHVLVTCGKLKFARSDEGILVASACTYFRVIRGRILRRLQSSNWLCTM